MTAEIMREMMAIMEDTVDADWSRASQAELGEYAALYRSDNDDGSAAYFDPSKGSWRYDPAFPLSRFTSIMSPAAWKQWIATEIANLTADLGHDRGYTAMMAEEIIEPIVLSIYQGKAHVWDGFHRIGVSFARGATTIKAVVGTPPVRRAPGLREAAVTADVAGGERTAAAPMDNPAFRSWFGNSKVVDAAGQPLIVFHGSPQMLGPDFQFDPARKGVSTFIGIPVAVQRHGFFFAVNRDFAESFAKQPRARGKGTVLGVYLRIERPLRMTEQGVDPKDIAALVAQGVDRHWLTNVAGDPRSTYEQFDEEDGAFFAGAIRAAGFDGVMMDELDPETNRVERVWIAFAPSQIKSATDNSGRYRADDPRIRETRMPTGADDPRDGFIERARTVARQNDVLLSLSKAEPDDEAVQETPARRAPARTVIIAEIEARVPQRGHGSRVMTELCRWADQMKIILVGQPQSDSLSTLKLLDWYERFGFRFTGAWIYRLPGTRLGEGLGQPASVSAEGGNAEQRIDRALPLLSDLIRAADPFGCENSEDPGCWDATDRWIEFEAKPALDAALARIERQFHGDRVRVFREITLAPDQQPDFDRANLYWSWDRDAAEAHWGAAGSRQVRWMLTAEVYRDEIDWPYTLAANAFERTEPECEIRLKAALRGNRIIAAPAGPPRR